MAIYNAEISAGSLMLPESRRVAKLLLMNPSKEEWSEALKFDNVLQKKSPATAKRQARLIRNRLEMLEEEAWSLISEGSQEIASQLLLAACIKHSRILADFMSDVYVGHLLRLERQLSPAKDWESFITECAQRDPDIAQFSDSTIAKMLQVVLRILAEVKYLDSTKTAGLTPPHLHPDVIRYLKRHDESQVLRTMDLPR